jgi:hypothetical protein
MVLQDGSSLGSIEITEGETTEPRCRDVP